MTKIKIHYLIAISLSLITIIFPGCIEYETYINTRRNFSNRFIYTISEINQKEDISNLSCMDSLPHENEIFCIKGNYYTNDFNEKLDRFTLRNGTSGSIDEVFNFGLISVRIPETNKEIKEILQRACNQSKSTWIEVVVKGRLKGWEQHMNTSCKKAIALDAIEIGIL